MRDLKRREPRILRVEELLSLSRPSWLVEGILQQNSLSMIYGPPGHGKTFVALDLALHIATGRPWFDRDVTHGQVIYVAAEGYQAVVDRLRAWLAFYCEEPPANFLTVIDPIDLHGGWETFNEFMVQIIGGAETEQPVYDDDGDVIELVPAPPVQLVIFDTLARCAYGADENSAQDMSRVIRWLDSLRDEQLTGLQTAVMILHHTTKSEQIERGSTALRGAADTMINCHKDDNGPVVRCSKQRSWEHFEPMDFSIVQLEDKSAVLIPRERVEHIAPARLAPDMANPLKPVRLGPTQLQYLKILAAESGPDGMSVSEVAQYLAIGMPQAVRIKTALVRYGCIMNDEGSRLFKCTRTGLAMLQEAQLVPRIVQIT